MKLVLLEQIAERGGRLLQDPSGSYGVQNLIRSLAGYQTDILESRIEPLILFDHVLREDPSGAYCPDGP